MSVHFAPLGKLTKIIAPTLLFFWVLASAHCELEQLPGLKFLVCCEHADNAAPHQDNDCQEDACSVVESGFYKIDDNQVSTSAPLLVLSYLLPGIESRAPAVPMGFACPLSAPPELPRIWQFSFRTALPPRAPSFFA